MVLLVPIQLPPTVSTLVFLRIETEECVSRVRECVPLARTGKLDRRHYNHVQRYVKEKSVRWSALLDLHIAMAGGYLLVILAVLNSFDLPTLIRTGAFFASINCFEIAFVIWMVPIVVRINEAANALEDLVHELQEDEEEEDESLRSSINDDSVWDEMSSVDRQDRLRERLQRFELRTALNSKTISFDLVFIRIDRSVAVGLVVVRFLRKFRSHSASPLTRTHLPARLSLSLSLSKGRL